MRMKRTEAIRSLRQLADLLEQHPELPQAEEPVIGIHVNIHLDDSDECGTYRRWFGVLNATEPDSRNGTCWASGRIGGILANVFFPGHLFARKRVVKTIEEFDRFDLTSDDPPTAPRKAEAGQATA